MVISLSFFNLWPRTAVSGPLCVVEWVKDILATITELGWKDNAFALGNKQVEYGQVPVEWKVGMANCLSICSIFFRCQVLPWFIV